MYIKELLITYKSIIAYLVLGVCTTVVNVVTYFLCYELANIPNVISTIIAWVAAVTFAFLTNKPLVFESKDWSWGVVYPELLKFYGCRIATGIIEVVGMFVLVDLFLFNGTVMKLLINILVIILNYIFSKLIVFK